jgi:hypothetical protein
MSVEIRKFGSDQIRVDIEVPDERQRISRNRSETVEHLPYARALPTMAQPV